MTETNREKEDSRDYGGYEDEIELIDILRVLWKWKYVIIGGTIACAIAAAAISFYMPKVYKVSMVLRPGILKVTEGGENVYIDSAKNVKAMIEAETFDKAIFSHLVREYTETKVSDFEDLEFIVELLKDSDTIKVGYETVNREVGTKAVEHLKILLINEYKKRVEYFRKEIETGISLKKAQIEELIEQKKGLEKKVAILRDNTKSLRLEVKDIRDNTRKLVEERNQFLAQEANREGILSSLLYSNTIQQNLELAKAYEDEINRHKIAIEEQETDIRKLEKEIDKIRGEIETLEYKKNGVQNIQVLKPPTVSRDPIKPRVVLNIALAAVAGLFLLVLISFFLEYISKYRNGNRREK